MSEIKLEEQAEPVGNSNQRENHSEEVPKLKKNKYRRDKRNFIALFHFFYEINLLFWKIFYNWDYR